jgi:hypothetical protein
MGVGFVGRGLGMLAAVTPVGVVTPSAIAGGAVPAPSQPAAETYRLTTEDLLAIVTESGDNLERTFFALTAESSDRVLTEDGELVEV